MRDLVLASRDVADVYHRLVLLVAPIASGKSDMLASVASDEGWALLNVNRVLAENLLEMDSRERAIRCKAVLVDAISMAGSGTVVLDNIEMLFEEHLQQDPLRLLKGLSRTTTLVVSWPGEFDGRSLTFAEPGHRDYRKYSDPEVRILSMHN